MRRVQIEPRPYFTRLVQSQGLVFADLVVPGESDQYWTDDRYYSFTSEETTLLEQATKDVHAMCCEAIDYLVEHPEIITGKMAVPAFALKQVIASWEREPHWGSIYGRFDVCFGGLDHPEPRLRVPKFYEFNADTPTSVVETGVIQWFWLQQTGHGNDQYNGLYEQLIEAWKRNLMMIQEKIGHKPVVFFATGEGEPSGEECMNTLVLMETCHDAGWTTKIITVEQITLRKSDGRFYSPDGEHIDVIFKLYPWEFMIEELFAEPCFKDMENIGKRDEAGNYIGGTVWIEPPYKLLWSNKAIFAIMWELFKDDPRSKWLLPTYFESEAPASLTSYARKPIFSREGADILLKAEGEVLQDETSLEYGREGYILQELALLPNFKDDRDKPHYPVLGMWVVDGDPAALGIREDARPITTNTSIYVPHSISDGPVNYERIPIPTEEEIEDSLRIDAFADPFQKPEPDETIKYINKITP